MKCVALLLVVAACVGPSLPIKYKLGVCGRGVLYNGRTHDCCKGRVIRRGISCIGRARCGKERIDLSKRICCTSTMTSLARPAVCPLGHYCGKVEYNFGTHDCCRGRVVMRTRSYKCTGRARCGKKKIDLSKERCCFRSVVKPRDQSCMAARKCAKEWYYPKVIQCCKGVQKSLRAECN